MLLNKPLTKKQKSSDIETETMFDKFVFSKQESWVAVAYDKDFFIGEVTNVQN